MELTRTDNYRNILFREQLEHQMDGIGLFDATWVLEFVRDNFTPDEVFTGKQIVDAAVEVSDIHAFENEKDMFKYIKDMCYPENIWTLDELKETVKELENE